MLCVPTTQEISVSNQGMSQRNLSLNLSPQHPSMSLIKMEDAMLANVITDNTSVRDCNERTRLLSRHENSNNNNNSTKNNNSGGDDDVLSEEALTGISSTMDSDTSDIHVSYQTSKKAKFNKLGTKGVNLKRVSFGSSKGSMVETVVFETPTPLSERVEPAFGFGSETMIHKSQGNMNDSGIEIQEESERSKVRVSIYQSSEPQQICPPEYYSKFDENLDNSNIEDIMTTVTTIPGYDRQQSTDSGWDNPFRPDGELSREADVIVNMIKGGRNGIPIEGLLISNGNAQKEENCNGTTVVENVSKSNVTQNQSAQNGTNSHRVQTGDKPPENNGVTSSAQVSKQVVPGPTSASHVVIDEKKNKKKGCCVIQ